MPIMSEEELQRLATAQERGELKVGPISLRDLPKCGSMVAQLTCPLCMSTTEVCAALAAWVQASLDEQQAHADLKARVARAIDALRAEARQLDVWAVQSREGGWSTHQVDPMRKRADDLRRLADELEDPCPDHAGPREGER